MQMTEDVLLEIGMEFVESHGLDQAFYVKYPLHDATHGLLGASEFEEGAVLVAEEVLFDGLAMMNLSDFCRRSQALALDTDVLTEERLAELYEKLQKLYPLEIV